MSIQKSGEAVSGRRTTFYKEDCEDSADNVCSGFHYKNISTRSEENAVFMFAGDQDCATALQVDSLGTFYQRKTQFVLRRRHTAAKAPQSISAST
jgi:hypothetical protein